MPLVQENPHELLDVFQTPAPGSVVLSINEDVLEPLKTLWWTPDSRTHC